MNRPVPVRGRSASWFGSLEAPPYRKRLQLSWNLISNHTGSKKGDALNLRHFLGVLLLVFLAACASVPQEAPTSTPASVAYDGWSERSLYIESFDGTRLAITVHVPTINGAETTERLPVIVTQDRSMVRPGSEQAMRAYTDRGYVWISQDRRGTGASFGVQTGFVNQLDARDAKAVIDWSATQPFSSGKTVAMGCSNQGAWQYLMATLRPTSLVAIAPGCASPQLFDDAIAINGVPMAALAKQPYAGECNRPPSGARPGNFAPPPARPVDDDKDGKLLAQAQEEQKCGAAMLGQYWLDMPRDGYNEYANYRPALDDTAMTHWREIQQSGIAILQLGAWYDAAVAGQIEGQRVLGKRLIMGPWVHGNRVGQGANLPNAERDLTAETIRFFDHYAKGIDNGADKPAIEYYTLNAPPGQEWTSVESWPDYPRTTMNLSDEEKLEAAAPTANGTPALYAPRDVSWFDGKYSPLNRWWRGDLGPTNAASLVHTSEPLAQDTEITGTIRGDLWISADQPDVDVFAMLQDVAPDGTATYVTDGWIRASWRKVHELPWGGNTRTWHRGYAEDIEPLVPGTPALLQFDFFPTSYVVKSGHRLRLALSTSIGMEYQSPPLAGGKKATITVYRDVARPSSISLPVRPH